MAKQQGLTQTIPVVQFSVDSVTSHIKTRNVNKSHFSTHILINDAKCHTEEMICMKWEFSSVGITTIQSTILYVLHYGS